MSKKRDPKVGTGKKPKGSGRRLYTDENPKDTVSIKFATMADAKATIAKVNRVKKPYARKIQILTVAIESKSIPEYGASSPLFMVVNWPSCSASSANTIVGAVAMTIAINNDNILLDIFNSK